MALAAVSLDDKYQLESGRIFLSGIQALVRLPIMQRQRDVAAGLDTGCFISGYRGSPLGGLDQSLWAARRFLENNKIHFQPGVNEDMAATAVWGSQQVGLHGDATVDGVFGMWYGKGPGVDRCGDVFKHANAAGTSKYGGVLAIAGDDHACRSSTLPHQSEHEFMSAMMPILDPAGVQEFLDFGLYGWAMSRYSGCWIGFKVTAETVESSASVYIDPHRAGIVLPDDFEMPPGGLNIRWPDWPPQDQEIRLQKHKLYAAIAFARANKLDRTVIDSPNPRLGIITTGKAYLDVMQALDDIGIDDAHAAEIGIRVYKVAMTWPIEREGMRHFAEGLEEILVVEEKRAVIENQLKEHLYNWREDVRPRVVGKFDEDGKWLIPSMDELTPAHIARVIAARIDRFYTSSRIKERLEFLDQKERALEIIPPTVTRIPYFCSGCPHNSSTRVPEGSRATAGIGCHFMSLWMDRETDTFTHMGGEGVPWVGQSPFVSTDHIFTNLGDGTYKHSGVLAIRASVAADVNITYKILYNDAVAMTGGQPVEGGLSVDDISRQVAAEGVGRIAVVSDEPDKYPVGTNFAAGVTFHHRDDLDAVQRELREWKGVSVLLYDQTCAAEKRRRRKRGLFPDPPKRIFINERVCEGCGDCSVQSNCLSVIPVETEFGRKRKIDQSSCNKDYSCLKGFCPSFVTVHGGRVRKRKAEGQSAAAAEALPAPELPAIDQPAYGIIVTGIGGTGVVTIGALIGMAAHIEGKGITVLDQTGLAQKGGAVTSHIRIAPTPDNIHAVRIAAGEADLILGCDLVVAASRDVLSKMRAGSTRVVVNAQETITGDFTHDPDLRIPGAEMVDILRQSVGPDATDAVDATRLATALLGDSIATNLFMLGFAWQKGLVPVSEEALMEAIALNGVAVDANKRAFQWGRRAAVDLEAVRQAALPEEAPNDEHHLSVSLDETVARRVADLTAYQDQAYAQRYADLVARVAAVEKDKAAGMTGLTEAVARYYYKLLAIKDEYEVARLYTDGDFLRHLGDQFEGDYRLEFNLAPPLLAERDPQTGHLKKRTFGPWMLRAFSVLARFKGLRGTAFDVFRRSAERKRERALIGEYETTVETLLENLNHDNHSLAVEIASLPEHIRGYGHVKERHVAAAEADRARMLENLLNPTPHMTAAE
ncbi:MAG: indolepyruvate ferredoxin oxidoreductase family protein [Alphaproteobacteria bacterium]|nr:indolepyruvate ferredoxin oxidoreductase family protein [Alphaproteobacteria bacterium]